MYVYNKTLQNESDYYKYVQEEIPGQHERKFGDISVHSQAVLCVPTCFISSL